MTQQLGPDDLEHAGVALYGERWQSDIARALGIKDSRRIRAFMARERPIPPGIWEDVATLLKQRGEHALELADTIRSRVDTQESPH